MNANTRTKVDKFIKESNDAGRAFDQGLWDTVAATIPADQRVEAEAEAREDISKK